jgi:hypothetical protein
MRVSDDASDIAGVGLAVAIDRRPRNDQHPMAEGLSGPLSGGPSAAKQEPLWFPKILSGWICAVGPISASLHLMLVLFRLLPVFIANLFKSRWRLEAENTFLHHQLNIALKRQPARLPLRGSDPAAGVDDPGGPASL